MRHSCALPRRNHSSNSSQMLTDKASTGKNRFNYPCLSKLFCFIMQKPILQIRIFAARNNNNIPYMSIEEAMMGGIIFKGKKNKPKEENKIKTKAKKKTYITGLHGSGAAKMKAEIRRKRANRHKSK